MESWKPTVNPWLIAIAVMSATFMEVLDTTIVNVALPHIAGSLSASIEEATWVLTSYLVANAIVLPATGWLSRTFGRKRFLITCIIIFTAASAICGAATSLPMLIIARVIQGAGGGALQPISQAVLLESFPPKKRGVAMAAFGMGVVVAPIIGPTLGGWLTDNYTWRWSFYLNLPIGVMAIMMIMAFIEDPPYARAQKRTKIDYWGFALLAVWVASLQIILDKGQQEDWLASHFIRWLGVIGISGLVAFLWRELSTAHPIVDLRVWKNRNFAMGTGMMTILGIVLYGCTALLPLFLQTVLGYPALQSGLTVSPRGFGSIFGMLLVGKLLGFMDGRKLIVIGFCILAYSTNLFGALNLDVASSNVMWPNIFNGFATALIFVPLTTLTMGTLANDQMGNATGIFNLMRNLGGGIGIAMVTTLLARRAQVHQAIMVGHLTPYNPAYQSAITALSKPFGSSPDAFQHASGLLYMSLLRQADLWAYVDNFRLLALLCVCCLPFVMLFKRTKGRGAAMAH
ncbi:MAG TPA: DHA2 family efflux MFS transporter permease subunit [Tepidisphaeraceae bacterium]|jgi:DHA2 family multidrug resistance protein